MKKSIGAMTLAFPTPVWIVGTYDKEKKTKCDDCGMGWDLLF